MPTENSELTTESHSYSALGSYNVTITAENLMGIITMFYTIFIQKSIMSEMFLVTTDSPVEYPGR